ncbi:hypothetical protein LCGC14_0972980 [marine sediment metagenome]|uniref:Lipoprotein n=2 Tax=root TaxID=1 RepID=A0A831VMV3_9FLAO|nr:hypothetical protein [Pricia antarctica]
MKKSLKFFTGFLVFLIMACGAQRSTQSNIEKTQEEMSTEGTDTGNSATGSDDSTAMDSESPDTSVQNNDETSSTTPNEQATTQNPPSANENMNIDDNSDMYTELEMTGAQVQNFESSLEEFQTRQKSMANGEMLGTVDDEKDRLLKEILSPEQYTSYQTWKKDN